MVRKQGPTPILSGLTNLQAPETFTDGQPLPKLLVFDLDYTLWPFWVDTHVTPPLKAKDNGTKSVDRWGETFTFYPHIPSLLLAAKSHNPPLLLACASRTHAPDLAHTLLKQLRLPPPPPPSPLDLLQPNPNHLQPTSNPTSTSTTPLPSPSKSTFSASDLKPPKSPSKSDRDGKEKKEGKEAKVPKTALEAFDYMQIFPGDKKRHFEKLRKDSGVEYSEMLFFDDEVRNRNVEELGVCFWLVRDGVTRSEVDRGVGEWRRRRGVGGE